MKVFSNVAVVPEKAKKIARIIIVIVIIISAPLIGF